MLDYLDAVWPFAVVFGYNNYYPLPNAKISMLIEAFTAFNIAWAFLDGRGIEHANDNGAIK